jgi:hypothetical protein
MNRGPPCFKVLVPCWNGGGETLFEQLFPELNKAAL